MTERSKKILLGVAFAVSTVLIGAALYFAFFRAGAPIEEEAVEPTVQELFPGVFLPEAREETLLAIGGEVPGPAGLQLADEIARGGETRTTQLTTSRVEGVAPGEGGEANFYSPSDGRFYAIDGNGELKRLSDREFPNVDSVEWNKDASKAVLEFPDGSNVVFDFESQQQFTLPRHWEDFEFSPSQDDIVAKSLALDPNNRWLVRSSSDGSNVQAFQALGGNDDNVIVSWSPNEQIVGFADTATPAGGGFERNMIVPVGFSGENFKGLVVEGEEFMPNWSPDGRKLLYSIVSSGNSDRPGVWIVDASPTSLGENRRSIGLDTWADKCTFSSSREAYCAVPQNLPDNAGLQRGLFVDYPDTLYRVDLDAGTTSLVAIPAQDTTINSPRVSSDGSLLYYVNGASGALESIRLK